MKKLFTLIELIVVIVVLSLLSAIVIPNISTVKGQATTAAIESNGKSIQTGVDMYKLEYGNYPTVDGKYAAIGDPKQVAFSKMTPEQLRNVPEKGFYWIDYKGEVVHSDTDTPSDVVKEGNSLTWKEPKHGEASKYRVYSVSDESTSAAKATKVILLGDTENLTYPLPEQAGSNEVYLVASVSRNQLVSPGVSPNTTYTGIDLAEVPGESVGTTEESAVPAGPVKKTPTTLGPYEIHDSLSPYSADAPKNIFKIDGGFEVIFPAGTNYNMYSNIYGLDGVRTEIRQLQGLNNNYKTSISNFDKDGNRYSFSERGDLHILNPNYTSTFIANLSQVLSVPSSYLLKTGIKVENGIAYLGYRNGYDTKHYLAIYDIERKTLLSKKAAVHNGSTNGYDETNVIIKGDYIYTAMLTNYTDSYGYILIVQWDKNTGNFLKRYLHHEYKETQSTLLFQDSNENIWYSVTPEFPKSTDPIRIYRLNEATFAGVEETITLPYSTRFGRVDDYIIHDNGDVQLFYQQASYLRSVMLQ